MGEGVAASLAAIDLPGAASGHSAFDRRAAERRARGYLRALGVSRESESQALLEQAMKRMELRAALGRLGEPLEAAVEEVHALLDQWLLSELGLNADPDALSAARAAVLGGDVPGWTARWAGLSGEPLAERIRAARVTAVPEPAPLQMEPSRIELCCYRLGLRLIAKIGRLLGLRGKRASSG
ncbi:hypothetical protein G3480_19645 [Thiorhodococcus mannitoliphagus]|uniref:Uncharacterized protein n=1 Tax=Thiorhodococcus mannitoliphagus TaxID=329406 RepID=A0A6P1E391_9GAMM|nr:hypothetical protein [Thiorhodococcus mannitoliphagus]NEX22494.1 hypothetical protein [Thiorhodococcus mannitoliphagus]